jgi:hypothetical protein
MKTKIPILIYLSFCLHVIGYCQFYHTVPVHVISADPFIEMTQGDVGSLKGIYKLNIIYENSAMTVGKYRNQNEYLEEKTAKYGSSPEGVEKAEKYVKRWQNAPTELYYPQFEETFNKFMHKRSVIGKNNNTDGTITLKIKTLKLEPGFNVYVAKQHAAVTMECIFLDRDENIILRYLIQDAPGRSAGYADFDTFSRIRESYAKAAKMLAKELSRELKRVNRKRTS